MNSLGAAKVSQVVLAVIVRERENKQNENNAQLTCQALSTGPQVPAGTLLLLRLHAVETSDQSSNPINTDPIISKQKDKNSQSHPKAPPPSTPPSHHP
jgi:hypothetical protein